MAVSPSQLIYFYFLVRLAPVFLYSRLEHPAGWICARYKSSVLLLLLKLLHSHPFGVTKNRLAFLEKVL